jgi:hypothetical protein
LLTAGLVTGTSALGAPVAVVVLGEKFAAAAGDVAGCTLMAVATGASIVVCRAAYRITRGTVDPK